MQILSMEAYLDQAIEVLSCSPLFHGLDRESLESVAENAELLRFGPGEALAKEGAESDSFLLLVEGGATVVLDGADGAPPVTLARISPPDSIGEMGVLLDQPRSASVYADGGAIAMQFTASGFHAMLLRHPYFGLVMCRTLASRLHDASRRIPLPELGDLVAEPDPEALSLLPLEFQIRHRVVPLQVAGDTVRLGCVDDLDPDVLDRCRRHLPGMAVRVMRISPDYFESTMRSTAGTGWFEALDVTAVPGQDDGFDGLDLGASQLEGVLRSMVAEGATELHMTPGRAPRWRIDGQLRPIKDAAVLGSEEALELVLDTVPRPRALSEFEGENAFELTHEIADVARFRIRLTRDILGISAVVRPVPYRVPTPDQLGLPQGIVDVTDRRRGLIVVAGSRGAGRSTSLAGLVGHIVRTRPVSVVTLEDPVQYIFGGGQAVVSQREVGRHVRDVSEGLHAARRDHADVVVISDLRDADAVPAMLDLAATSALVLVGVDVDGAVDAIERLVSMCPSDERAAAARSLSRCLLAVSSQVLARRPDGGQIAAFEMLTVSPEAAARLADQRFDRLMDWRTPTMDQALAARVEKGEIKAEEALRIAPDRSALERRLNDG